MVVFVGLVFVAYAYVLRKGGLEWEDLDQPRPRSSGAGVGPVPAGRA